MMTFLFRRKIFRRKESQPTERSDLFCFLEEYIPRKINYETVPKFIHCGKKTTTGWTILLRNTLWPNSAAQKTRRLPNSKPKCHNNWCLPRACTSKSDVKLL
jgi:hypothetical protein